MSQQYWAQYKQITQGPFETREAAAASMFQIKPNLKEVMTGYGTFGPSFDIRWIKREEISI